MHKSFLVYLLSFLRKWEGKSSSFFTIIFCIFFLGRSQAATEFPASAFDFALGAGGRTYQDGSLYGVAQGEAGLSLFLAPSLQGRVSLALLSPLQEEDGLMLFPPRQWDIVHIHTLSLDYSLDFWRFLLGKYADSPREGVPQNSPYYSLGLQFLWQGAVRDENPEDVETSQRVQWLSQIRLDRLVNYATHRNAPAGAVLGRYGVESSLLVPFLLPRKELSLQAKIFGKMLFFADPSSQLSSLSLGRTKYIATFFTGQEQRYRLLSGGMEGKLYEKSLVSLETSFVAWKNMMAEDASLGMLGGAGFTQKIDKIKLSNSLFYWYFNAQKNSIPPVELSENYFPGFIIDAIEFKTRSYVSDNYAITLQIRKQFIKNISFPAQTFDALRGLLPNFIFIVTFSKEFPHT